MMSKINNCKIATLVQGDMGEESKTILRNIRDNLVDMFVALARVLFFWLPGEVAQGQALMACHPILIGVFVAAFFYLSSRHPLRFLIVALSILVVASQWLLGGCVITRAEQRLTGQKDTIVDPFLKLAGLEVNRNTRIAATLGVGTAMSGIMIWVTALDIFRTV
jgi:uncharacterized membrane protein YfcA